MNLVKNIVEGILIGIMVASTALIVTAAVNPKLLQPAPKKLDSIVRLTDNGRTFCTGTVVNDTTIITAAHCVLTETMFGNFVRTEPIDIRTNDNTPLQVFAKPYYATTQMDHALLFGDFRRFEPKKYIANPSKLTKFKKKDLKFRSCGYPLGGDLYCSTTIFIKPYGFMFGVEGTLIPGMSGGPTMLEDGTMIAVNVAVNEDISIVSPIHNIDFNFRDNLPTK